MRLRDHRCFLRTRGSYRWIATNPHDERGRHGTRTGGLAPRRSWGPLGRWRSPGPDRRGSSAQPRRATGDEACPLATHRFSDDGADVLRGFFGQATQPAFEATLDAILTDGALYREVADLLVVFLNPASPAHPRQPTLASTRVQTTSWNDDELAVALADDAGPGRFVTELVSVDPAVREGSLFAGP